MAVSESFDVVFGVYHDYVYSLAHTLLGNPQDAEDVTQEVFLRVYRALPRFDPQRASMQTWITTLSVNACRSHRRSWLRILRRRAPAPIEDYANGDENGHVGDEMIDLSPFGAPEEEALRSEVRRTITEVLNKLRLEHRAVLVLHYYHDLPAPEIARILGCPEGTVYSRLHHARRMVLDQLKRRAMQPGGDTAEAPPIATTAIAREVKVS